MKKTWLALGMVALFSTSVLAETPTNTLKENELEALVIKIHSEIKHGGYELMSVAELKELVDSKEHFVLIDAHPQEAFNQAHVQGATNFTFEPQFTRKWKQDASGESEEAFKAVLGKDENVKVIVYCGHLQCTRSHTAALWARELGFHHVYRIAGGIKAWQEAGYPVESSKK